LQRVVTLEVENEQLQFVKSISKYDEDKPDDKQNGITTTEDTNSNSALDDLGFPDDDPSAENGEHADR